MFVLLHSWSVVNKAYSHFFWTQMPELLNLVAEYYKAMAIVQNLLLWHYLVLS